MASASGYERNDLKMNEYVSPLQLKRSPFITNILLLGVDSEGDDSGRSDSMILVSLDFLHMKIKMSSFLRDSYVYIPCRDRFAKLNSAYAYGGAQGITDAIEYNFEVDVNHFVKVDFKMFTDIIDTLGGIDIEVTEEEKNFINKTTRYTVESGKSVHLSGSEALVYARIRKLDSDYMRTYRQRKVLNALISKAKTASFSELYNAAKSVFPLIETDMSPAEVTALCYKFGVSILGFDTSDIRVPEDDQMTTGYVGDEWVEKPDLDKCRKYLQNFIFNE
ncbi:MAG: LCP family protein [Clostridiales bacterium]|nr:LCP family protein [Clostridiales bacterium]